MPFLVAAVGWSSAFGGYENPNPRGISVPGVQGGRAEVGNWKKVSLFSSEEPGIIASIPLTSKKTASKPSQEKVPSMGASSSDS